MHLLSLRGVGAHLVVVVGGRWGGGGADVQLHVQLDGVIRNKLIYQRIATALWVQSYLGAVCPEDQKPSAEMQIG